MTRAGRAVLGVVTGAALCAAGMSAGARATTVARTQAAPGGPGAAAAYLPADKSGFGTALSRSSKVWYTLQPGGGTGELYYPDLGTPAARSLSFAVVGPSGKAVKVSDAAADRTTLADATSLTYRETDTARNHAWQLVTTYVTDPRRSGLQVHVRFTARHAGRYRLYVLYEPTLSNTPSDDTGRSAGATLVASDAHAASALLSRPGFAATSTGYRGSSDGWTDLSDGRMDWQYRSAAAGNIVQTARTPLTGRRDHRRLTLSLGFAATPAAAEAVANASARTGFARSARAYAAGWRRYLRGLEPAPHSVRSSARSLQEYRVSEMVLAASEDKTHRGAYVASPTMPWAWGEQNPSGPYHLVWSRDLYEIATALIADGDRAGANRALSFLFDTQQKSDGSFPQNSDVAGTPVWTGLQLDEVADPIVLAYQLHRTGATDYAHVRKAADFLVDFTQDGNASPWTPQERWENQSGYSPATIASEVAGLVCAASIAVANGDTASARRYLRTADAWHAHLKGWTATSTGPYSTKPYFLRLSKDGDPDAGTTYSIGDSGPGAADQRSVVDPSFLELVRLGVLRASDPTIANSLRVVDKELSYPTAHGTYWHRASFDGYGETATGGPWVLGSAADTFVTHGRGWPLLNGERGEYDLAAGQPAGARMQLATLAAAANTGYLLPEQVWDDSPPGATPGFTPGTPTDSATPLAWTHAQFIRLAHDISSGTIAEQPRVVALRYAR